MRAAVTTIDLAVASLDGIGEALRREPIGRDPAGDSGKCQRHGDDDQRNGQQRRPCTIWCQGGGFDVSHEKVQVVAWRMIQPAAGTAPRRCCPVASAA